jgi:hypothetical protein
VKEEVANILMIESAVFDDENSLMEIQRFKKEEEQEIVLNFNEEPNKSQKQILKLIKTINMVQTRANFYSTLSAETLESMKEDQKLLNIETTSDSEEKAALIYQGFHHKTSVIYDI